MPRKQIMDNPGFRLAILDEHQKTTAIAVKYGMSYVRTRELRAKYGRPAAWRLPSGFVSSTEWQKYPDWVRDIQTLTAKAVHIKYGWSCVSITRMRKQLGVGADAIIASKEFKEAIKTRPAKEVSAVFGVSAGAVAMARKRLKVTKPHRKLWLHRRAVGDLAKLTDKEFAAKWKVSTVHVRNIRWRVNNPPKYTPKSARLP